MNEIIKLKLVFLSLFVLMGASHSAHSANTEQDEVLDKLLEWHLGFSTNQAQHDADMAAGEKPVWALSELRFTKIWPEREDGYWLYYEISQAAVRPDRNEILRLYRNDVGDLKLDIYRFKDIDEGLTFWGKSDTPEVFEQVGLEDLVAAPAGCHMRYHWLEESNKFSGINSHYECPVGNGYILQHIEISKDADGVLQRNDWHWFFDGEGVAKTGPAFKLGNMGPYIHKYVTP